MRAFPGVTYAINDLSCSTIFWLTFCPAASGRTPLISSSAFLATCLRFLVHSFSNSTEASFHKSPTRPASHKSNLQATTFAQSNPGCALGSPMPRRTILGKASTGHSVSSHWFSQKTRIASARAFCSLPLQAPRTCRSVGMRHASKSFRGTGTVGKSEMMLTAGGKVTDFTGVEQAASN